jgi:hypothetical protein
VGAARVRDADGDGLTNLEEYQLGTTRRTDKPGRFDTIKSGRLAKSTALQEVGSISDRAQDLSLVPHGHPAPGRC